MKDFLESLRENAVFVKLTSKEKYGGAVSVEDILKVLKSLTESYNSFIEAEYSKLTTQQDRKKLKKIIEGLSDENTLMLVDLKFESCSMALTPNTKTISNNIPNIKNQLDWKKKSFEIYKNEILQADFNDIKFLDKISSKYSPNERYKIFKPIIDGIADNKNATTLFGFNSSAIKKPLVKPKQSSYNTLLPAPDKFDILMEAPLTKTAMAKVEIKGGKVKPKVIELFEQLKYPSIPIESVLFGDKTYSFKHPLYCDLIHEDDSYGLENKQIGIFAFGKTEQEARESFAEEFDYIYTRYNSLSTDKLSDDVRYIRDYLNLIVKK
ncbi:MAG: hypothetical protein WC150_09035 [Bacteroidia bacterium]